MEQMRREMEDLQSRLDQAEQTILHLTTSKAAELVNTAFIIAVLACCVLGLLCKYMCGDQP